MKVHDEGLCSLLYKFSHYEHKDVQPLRYASGRIRPDVPQGLRTDDAVRERSREVFRSHRGHKFASSSLIHRMTKASVGSMEFATQQQVPLRRDPLSAHRL
jgi:hypothetical protein